MNKDVWDDIGRAVTGAADTVSRKASARYTAWSGRSGRIMRLWESWYTIGIQRKAVRRSPSRNSVKRSPAGKS